MSFVLIFILQTIYNYEYIIIWKIFPLIETYIIEYGHCINNTTMVQNKLSSKSFFNNLMTYHYSRFNIITFITHYPITTKSMQALSNDVAHLHCSMIHFRNIKIITST